jgi:hypothetical protein
MEESHMKPIIAHITLTPHWHPQDVGLVILGMAAFVMFLVVMAIIANGKE